MRVVVVTTYDDPLSRVFWEAYRRAGGLPPAAVLFLVPRRRRPAWRAALEGVLLFGPAAAARAWRMGRRTGRVLRQHPAQVFGDSVEFYTLRGLSSGPGLEVLRGLAPDLLVSVGSPEILRPAALGTARVGAVNVHNGRLPAYRGLFGTFWEARAGEAWGYASIHVMEPGIDTGAVLAQGGVPLEQRPILDVLAAKKELGGRLLAWLVQQVSREARLPPARPTDAAAPSAYYSWPTLRDLAVFRLRRLRAARRAEVAATAESWPTGMVHDR